LIKSASAGQLIGADSQVAKDLQNLNPILDKAAQRWNNYWGSFSFNAFDNSSLTAQLNSLQSIGKNLATVAQTNLPQAQNAFAALAHNTDGSRKELTRL